MHLRYFARVQFIAALVIACFLSYSVWIRSTNADHGFPNPWTGPIKRIIVFGDSFSRSQSVEIAGTDHHSRAEEIENHPWTEVLRNEVSPRSCSTSGTGKERPEQSTLARTNDI